MNNSLEYYLEQLRNHPIYKDTLAMFQSDINEFKRNYPHMKDMQATDPLKRNKIWISFKDDKTNSTTRYIWAYPLEYWTIEDMYVVSYNRFSEKFPREDMPYFIKITSQIGLILDTDKEVDGTVDESFLDILENFYKPK